MRLFNGLGKWRFRSSIIATAVISTLLVPVTLFVTADTAFAAVDNHYCANYSGTPIMVNDDNSNSNGDYYVRTLNVSGDAASQIHTLNMPNGYSINAVGISPIDKKAYGVVGGASNSPLLARFDNNEVEYVAEVKATATQGTFDAHGDFLYSVKSSGDTSGLYRVERPDQLQAYTNQNDSSLPDQSNPTNLISASIGGTVADWAAIRADLGSGVANYVVGIRNSSPSRVVVIKYADTATTSGSVVSILTPDATMPTGPFRNAYYHEGRLLFHVKKGELWELETGSASDINISSGTANVTNLGDSTVDGGNKNIKDGDGMACFDSPGFTVTESGGDTSVNESGTTDTFTVVLDSKPVGNVVIGVTSGDTDEATVSPSSLTFTTGNWNSAQTVTVTGVDESDDDGDQDTTITLSVTDGSTDDIAYDGVANQTVTAETVDNDPQAGFTVAESGGGTSVAETGTTDTFTVVLDAQPDSNVVIDVSSGDTDEATVSPSSLTFTTGNWNSAQTVTVTGVADNAVDGSQNTTITMAVNDGSSDNNFDSLSDQTVTAATTDPWGFTVTQSGGTTAVAETGSTDTFTVVLDAQPSSDVVIGVSSGDTD
ncbi:MAG: hypothetical protein P8L35_06795, partial [Acidimicrobiales bacterium]|nr:hypothetical protein [Acidimicrobiales bacterium]